MTEFTHLHLHSDYSMLDGLKKPALFVEEGARLGMSHMALTDHGTMSGMYEFYMACKEAGIAPIPGCEFYFVPNAQKVKDEKIGERFHIVMLAKNADGYRTLCALNDEAHQRFYYKPVLDRGVCEALAYEEAENLVVLSGCAASILSRKVRGEIEGSATQELMWWRETFPNFYIELQHHNTDFDRVLNSRLLKLARKYKLPWVITNDPHYVKEEECDYHDALLAIQTNSGIDDEDRFRFDGDGYHLRTRSEIARAFRAYGQEVWKPGIIETQRIARQCDVQIPEWDKKSWHIPKYHKLPKGRTSDELLRRLAKRGLRERGLLDDPAYQDRLEYELEKIEEVGIADFLLINADIIDFARNHKTPEHPRGIWVGPGRGSTAGSLVCYGLGLHKIDPIRYRLLFERFLNPDRPKMPDIDTDFSQAFRQEAIEYTMHEYGSDFVLPVAAFQTMQVRGAFRKLATAMGMPFSDLSKFTAEMVKAWGREDDDEEGEEHIRVDHLPDELVDAYPELVEYIEGVLGTKSAISRHAAGIVIFDPEDSIRTCVPTMWVVSSKRFACQFDLKSAEKMGLMKQDFLGLRTGDTIEEARTLIEEQTGDLLEPDSWVPDEEEGDRDVYRMMAEGRNAGVFQLEGGTMAEGIVKIKPHRFEDVVACTSIYRKGPMLAGAPDRYIANKKAKEIRVIHPALHDILSDTWGEMAYQEQLMQIASQVAGFDQGLVADLLAAVRFKDPKMMAPLKSKFIKGCASTSRIGSKTANRIWAQFETQASYLFNRSHAVSYSMTTYQTARLKCWWPLQYLTALMRTVEPKKENRDKRMTYLAEATDLGFKILPPDINFSEAKMSCGERKGRPWMRFGFWDVKGFGVPTAQRIIAARAEAGGRFRTMKEVTAHLPPGVVQKLSLSGCLHSVKDGPERSMAHLEEVVAWQFEDVMAPLRVKYKDKVRLPGRGDGRVRLMGEIIDQKSKVTKNGKPYVTWRIRWTPSEIFTVTIWEDAESVWNTPKGSIIVVEGKWSSEFRNVAVWSPDQMRVLRYKKEAV